LTGPVSLDMQAIAQKFSPSLGRTVTYVDVWPDTWRESKLRLPVHVMSHIETMARLHRANRYDRFSDDVERLTGAAPMGIREFVEKNAQAFRRTSRVGLLSCAVDRRSLYAGACTAATRESSG